MAAYIIVDVEVTDPKLYAEYKQQVPATLEPYGGRFLCRGGVTERLEGDWKPARVVVLEFDSVEQARGWWSSTGYAAPKALRQRSARSNMILVEGVD